MNSRTVERGQALIMVTFASLAMFAIIGLATDLGWDYFTKRKTQAAADAAALAGARNTFDSIGADTPVCGANVTCQPATACPAVAPATAANAIDAACIYAQQNGYTTADRKRVLVAADTTSPYVTATGTVSVRYWVSVVVSESVPQLFSAVSGNTMATVASRATGAVAETVFDGNLILLDRQNDPAGLAGNGGDYYGVNLLVQANDNHGQYAVQVNGILLSSNCNGSSVGSGNCTTGNKPAWAGMNQGGGTVFSPYTTIRMGGGVDLRGGSQWTQPPQNSAMGRPFNDPMSGMGQPPAPTGLDDVPIPGGVIDGSVTPTLYPGNYYAADATNGCPPTCTATGDPIAIKGTVRFAACSGCAPGTALGRYVFFGGLKGSGSGANVTFDPGQYVFAGARWRGNTAGMLLDTSTNFNISDSGSSVGELFVFTDLNYPGLQLPSAVAQVSPTMTHGQVYLTSGNNGTNITLHGLNPASSLVKSSNLRKFAKTLAWQDQSNSRVKYTAQGNIDTSCGSLDSPCTNTLTNPTSPQINLQASPSINLYGIIYQPRGAWTVVWAGSGYNGPLQLISGALEVQANAALNLSQPTNPITYVSASLIE